MKERKNILIIGGACQGKTAFARERFPEYEETMVDDLQERMKEYLRGEPEAVSLFKKLAAGEGFLVISREVGSGVVPMEREERCWREETGRMLTRLASLADEVYRVFCGIPVRLK